MVKILREYPKASTFGVVMLLTTWLSCLSSRGDVSASVYLSEWLFLRNFEPFILLLISFQMFAIAFAHRGRTEVSQSFIWISEFTFSFYPPVVGALFGWAVGVLLAHWQSVPFSGYLLVVLFMLWCSLPLYFSKSVEKIVKKITSPTLMERKLESYGRIIALVAGAYSVFCILCYFKLF